MLQVPPRYPLGILLVYGSTMTAYDPVSGHKRSRCLGLLSVAAFAADVEDECGGLKDEVGCESDHEGDGEETRVGGVRDEVECEDGEV